MKAALKRARRSKAQKAAWKRRKAEGNVKAELPFNAASRREIPAEAKDAVEYVNSAPTPAERQIRKQEVYALLYGAGPKTCRFDSSKDNVSNVPKEEFSTDKIAGAKCHFGEQLTDRHKTGPYPGSIFEACAGTNPKTLTGQQKVPVLSVVPATSIIAQATAMRYGAFFAPKVDGTRGYGPYNWRDQPIEAHVYIDAALRHLMQWFDGDESEIIYDDVEGIRIDEVSHLAFALATIGILLDAQANCTLIDDRPKVRNKSATHMLCDHKLPRTTK
jgi:hypothetical protein